MEPNESGVVARRRWNRNGVGLRFWKWTEGGGEPVAWWWNRGGVRWWGWCSVVDGAERREGPKV